MYNFRKRESINDFEDLCLVETGVSNKEANAKFGNFARLSLIVIKKDVEFKMIRQKECKVIISKIFKKTDSNNEKFKATKRYMKSSEGSTYLLFDEYFDEYFKELKEEKKEV